MQTRPIIFSTEMVKAILDGRKTQTRRVVAGGEWVDMVNDEYISLYGKKGDRLWVRETWRIVGWDEDGDWCIEYKDGSSKWFFSVQDIDEDAAVRYWEQCSDDCIKAGVQEDDAGYFNFDNDRPCPTRWRSAIFLPRWASRITLEIVDVDVQRLQQICESEQGEKDAIAEGFPMGGEAFYESAGDWYQGVWDSINGKRAEGAYSWQSNPWVWVITFKLISKGVHHESE